MNYNVIFIRYLFLLVLLISFTGNVNAVRSDNNSVATIKSRYGQGLVRLTDKTMRRKRAKPVREGRKISLIVGFLLIILAGLMLFSSANVGSVLFLFLLGGLLSYTSKNDIDLSVYAIVGIFLSILGIGFSIFKYLKNID